MSRYVAPIFAVLVKDVMLEIRTKNIVVSVIVFALLVIVIFNLALELTPRTLPLLAPGILWVAFTFGGVLGLNHSFATEQERGNLYGLMLAPVSRESIFFGKLLGNFLFMMIIEMIIYPIFAVLYNLPLLVPGFVPVAILATLGIVTVGTTFSAIAINTRSREVMLPVLFFPVIVPIIIAAVEASGIIIRGEDSGELTLWIPFLILFDALFLVICPTAFSFIIEE